MGIRLTSSALAHVQQCLQQQTQSIGLRIKVKPSGCSGYAYALDFAENIETQDQVFEQEGVKVLVDTESLKVIDGTEVDYVQEGVNRFFRFNNPNVKDECGCGESFNI